MWLLLCVLLLFVLFACGRRGSPSALGLTALDAFDSSLRLMSQQRVADKESDESSGEEQARPSRVRPTLSASAPARSAPRTQRRVTPFQKKRACASAGWKCESCGRTVGADFEVDHTHPLWAGGSNRAENLACVCRDCHRLKTSLENSERMLGTRKRCH